MLAIERRSEIIENMKKNQSVLVSELSKQYNVSEETIRRDLEKLEKEGLVKKTYGGAVFKQNIIRDTPIKIRERFNKEEKLMIAKKIADLIEDGESLMLDSSSTVLSVARALKQKKKLTIITNSVEILFEYAENKNFNIISTGGNLRDFSLSLVGTQALNLLKGYNVDKAIISCKGIDIENGITESNELESDIKKAMFKSAKQRILTVDSSKFNTVSFVKFLDINMIDIIATDTELDEKWNKYFNEKGIRII